MKQRPDLSFIQKAGKCFGCGYEFDAAAAINNDRTASPQEGDFSICIACGEPAIFTADGSLRQPTKEEAAELWQNPEVVLPWQSIQRLRAISGDWPTGPGGGS